MFTFAQCKYRFARSIGGLGGAVYRRVESTTTATTSCYYYVVVHDIVLQFTNRPDRGATRARFLRLYQYSGEWWPGASAPNFDWGGAGHTGHTLIIYDFFS